MKTLALLLTLFSTFPATGAPVRIAGKWQGIFRVSGGEHDVPQLLILRENGVTLAGTAGPDAAERYPIANGHLQGDHATFELTTGDWKFFYDLHLAGESLQGTLTLKKPGETRTAKVDLHLAR